MIPIRFQQHNFAPFAVIIGLALKRAPDGCIELKPFDGMAMTTFLRRIRESLGAKKLYGWKDPAIDENLWLEYNTTLVASETKKGTVLFGVREAIKTASVAAIKEAIEAYEFKPVDFNHLSQLCSLWKSFQMPRPPVFISNLSDAEIISLESQYDIAFAKSENENQHFIV